MSTTDSLPKGYCMKCRAQRTLVGAQEAVMSTGRRMLKGACAVCGTTVTRILGK